MSFGTTIQHQLQFNNFQSNRGATEDSPDLPRLDDHKDRHDVNDSAVILPAHAVAEHRHYSTQTVGLLHKKRDSHYDEK